MAFVDSAIAHEVDSPAAALAPDSSEQAALLLLVPVGKVGMVGKVGTRALCSCPWYGRAKKWINTASKTRATYVTVDKHA